MPRTSIISLFCAALIGMCGITTQAQVSVTHVIGDGQVEQVSTALHHISIISLPDNVRSAAIGSSLVRMEWHGNRIMIEPLKDGVDTDLFVFVGNSNLTYEILPAGDPEAMSYVIQEVYPPVPMPPPGPSAEELQRQRDGLLGGILMTTTPIKHRNLSKRDKSIQIRIINVSEDARNFYVRLEAVNAEKYAYRIQTPVILKIDPAFGSNLAYAMVDQQINQHTFNKFKLYGEHPLDSHGSTLVMHDMQPGESTQWVMAIDKPKISPSMYEFSFPDDSGEAVIAIAIF